MAHLNYFLALLPAGTFALLMVASPLIALPLMLIGVNPESERAKPVIYGLAATAWAMASFAVSVAGRLAYPYDLEWMEGGLLGHAARLADQQGIYVEPSIDFIPYLYTPLYPALIALVSEMFGLNYVVGRAISLIALAAALGFIAEAIVRERGPHRAAGWVGAALACGLVAATYPWVDGWYDLVRADTGLRPDRLGSGGIDTA